MAKPVAVTKVNRATLRQAGRHQIRPAHVVDARADVGVVEAQRTLVRSPLRLPKVGPPKLDVAAFGEALHAKFAATTTGYAT